MRFLFFFKFCSYLLISCGYLALLVSDYTNASVNLLVVFAWCSGWILDEFRIESKLYTWIWNFIAAAFLGYFVYTVFRTQEVFYGAVDLSIFIQIYKLLNKKADRDYKQMYAISFFQLLAAATLTVSASFLILAVSYMLLSVWTFALFHIKREFQQRERLMELHHQKQGVHIRTYLLHHLNKVIEKRFFVFSTYAVLIAVLATFVIFYSFPRLDRRFIGWVLARRLEGRQRIIGFSKRVSLGDYGPIASDNTLVMRVKLPQSSVPDPDLLHWRGGVLDTFDGKRWNVGYSILAEKESNPEGVFIVSKDYSPYMGVTLLDRNERLTKQQIFIESITSDTIFAASYPVAIIGDFLSLKSNYNDALFFKNKFYKSIEYRAYSKTARPTEQELRHDSRGFEFTERSAEETAEFRGSYLQLPQTLDARIYELVAAITRKYSNPYDKIMAVKQYLETNYRYSLTSTQGQSSQADPLVDFLFDTKRGHCEYFSTAMAVLLRCINIPTRLVNGFQRGEWNAFGEFYTIRQRDAHAWVEVRFPTLGWVEFDPSPRSVLAETGGTRSEFFRFLTQYMLALRMEWQEQVIGYNRTEQQKLFRGMEHRVLDFRKQFVLRLKETMTRLSTVPFESLFGRFALLAAVILVLLAVFLCIAGIRLAYRFRNVLRQKQFLKHYSFHCRKVIKFYIRMLRILAQRGIVRQPTLTPREFAEVVLHKGKEYASVPVITEWYYEARYGGRLFSEGEVANIETLITLLKEQKRKL